VSGVGQYVVRVQLPDRPGALGQVASRIGAVGGDIVAIHILSRGQGRAVDEFVIELDSARTALLESEIHEVDGVTVEQVAVRPASGATEGDALGALP
jgi:ACT domain-containing protein